jgi:hypothetical protein
MLSCLLFGVLVEADKRTKFLAENNKKFFGPRLCRNRTIGGISARDTMKQLLLAGILLATPAYAEDTSCAHQENRWDEHFQTWRMTCIETIPFNSTTPLPSPDDDNYPDPNIKKPDGWVYHTPTMDDLPRWLKLDCSKPKNYWARYRRRFSMCR